MSPRNTLDGLTAGILLLLALFLGGPVGFITIVTTWKVAQWHGLAALAVIVALGVLAGLDGRRGNARKPMRPVTFQDYLLAEQAALASRDAQFEAYLAQFDPAVRDTLRDLNDWDLRVCPNPAGHRMTLAYS